MPRATKVELSRRRWNNCVAPLLPHAPWRQQLVGMEESTQIQWPAATGSAPAPSPVASTAAQAPWSSSVSCIYPYLLAPISLSFLFSFPFLFLLTWLPSSYSSTSPPLFSRSHLFFFEPKLLAESLGQTRAQALVFFHSFTGSDTTSAFKGIGKKKAYQALKAYPEIKNIFADFHQHPFPNFDENDDKFAKIQRFVILMHSQISILNSVNEARMDLYFTRTQNIETIPPTKNALFLHTRRSLYQSGIWSRCLEADQNLPSPKDFGWMDSGELLGP